MAQPYQVVQAFDRAPIAEIPTDDAGALEAQAGGGARGVPRSRRLARAARAQRVLRRDCRRCSTRGRTRLRSSIAQEGGKPLSGRQRRGRSRAIDGLRNAAEELRNFAGKEIPMGLTPASDGRWAFTPRSRSASSPRSRPSTIR